MGKRKIELLAPAKNLKCGIAAIEHGADAVYIGGPKFSARAAASNNLEDIQELVGLAHQWHAKVYVALNTILNDSELTLAEQFTWQLFHIGVDAIIIQDMGLLECDLPPIALHASTQVNNRDVEKVRFLEKVGFSQVVLARELSLQQIADIRQSTTIKLECFIHGALCVSYSGQCYISEVMCGRSANRGECAQYCRHIYSLRDSSGRIIEKDRHLLSLKDLDLSAHLEALLAAGIDSFKIEGRLKDEMYVKNITAFYRQLLDRIIAGHKGLSKASSGRCSFSFCPDTSKSFSRGKTDYFLQPRSNSPGAIESPKSIGKKLGAILTLGKDNFTISTKEVVNNGDGLCFFNENKKLEGIRVNKVIDNRIYPRLIPNIAIGTEIYRNFDAAFSKKLINSKGCRKLSIRIELKEMVDGLLLTITDEDNIVSCTRLITEKQVANQLGVAATMAEKQLRKIGETSCVIEAVKVDFNPSSYFSSAIFNKIRRDGFDNHTMERVRRYSPEREVRTNNSYPWPSEEVTYLDNISNAKALEFYKRHGVKRISENGLSVDTINAPILMFCKYCIKAQISLCPKNLKRQVKIVEPLILYDDTAEFILIFDCKKCEMTIRKRR